MPNQLPVFDWAVIAFYALGMLAVGWYYSRRIKNTEDYLLGGRQMRPLAVGLSLFASLLSTISYLGWPGEMIKYGPMLMAGFLAYPLVWVLAGWLIIPRIMCLKVTTAYEILETRLGLSTRVLGSTLFLLMRLLWMAVIIYASADKVLIPLLGLDARATPWVCAVMGLITVIYTSMGGLRAVVLTDVIQTVILFAGAVFAIILVTVDLGGMGAWFPSRWPAHWPEPVYGYDPDARITMFGAILAMFTWWICTSCSDQIAIQRYLATRDAKAARRVLGISLAADAIVGIFLSALGLALLAYFQSHPDLLLEGQTALGDADKLFPRFILICLPKGITGLVIAGLLAAAMSSLSSGVNSACSVITTDFLDRFRRREENEPDWGHVRLAKYVSVIVGVVIVLLSTGVGMVEGNLLEVTFKVTNLLVAPLAGLFFMALFVPWATESGTLVGAAFGLTVVVAVNYWETITQTPGISFIWAMPLGITIQLVVGMLVSLILPGPKADDGNEEEA